jgi:ribonuclease BN (tRNA processing enzyme)
MPIAIPYVDRIAITHLHTDHVADLPALLKGGYFFDRSRPLPLLGPPPATACSRPWTPS